MASATVRISEQARQALREIAAESGESMQAVLDKAVDAYRRKRFFEQLNADYEALRADPEAWAEYQKELAVWDATLMDGLDPDEQWGDSGEAVRKQPEP